MEIVNQGQRLIETRAGKVYLCDWGKLYILDEQTGNVLFQNTEINMGAAALYTFDENGYLYTASYLAPIYKIDPTGKVILNTFISNLGYYHINKLYINSDSKLVVECPEDENLITKIELNKDTFSIENVSSNYTSELNGEYKKEIGTLKIDALSDAHIFYSFRLEKNNLGYVDGTATKQDGVYVSYRGENIITFKFVGNSIEVSEQYDKSKYTISSPECGGGVYLSGTYVKK